MLPGWSGIFGRSMRSTGSTFVVGGDQVADHKPAPDVYQLALTRLRVSCAEAVAVEDTGHGVDAAHAAGLACIAIPNPTRLQSTGQAVSRGPCHRRGTAH